MIWTHLGPRRLTRSSMFRTELMRRSSVAWTRHGTRNFPLVLCFSDCCSLRLAPIPSPIPRSVLSFVSLTPLEERLRLRLRVEDVSQDRESGVYSGRRDTLHATLRAVISVTHVTCTAHFLNLLRTPGALVCISYPCEAESCAHSINCPLNHPESLPAYH